MPRVGMAIFSPCSTSATLRLRKASCTAPLTSARARSKNRWRLLRLLPFGFWRRSTTFINASLYRRPSKEIRPSAGLVHAHVPLDEAADLPLSVAARHHALQEVSVLLFGLGVFLAAEADHRQQILHLGEHPPLDDLSQLFVRLPRRVPAAVVGAGSQREFDDFIAEVLG